MATKMETKYYDDKYSIKVFYPNVVNLFAGKLRKMTLHDKLRFYIVLISGYRVYYLFNNDEEIGYCIISNGGSFRYPFSTKKDIIVGPYFIKESYRGKNLSTFLINKCIKEFETNYRFAFDFIQKNNIASIKTTIKCGFQYLYDGKYTKYFRRLMPVEPGEGNFLIYKYNKKTLESI